MYYRGGHKIHKQLYIDKLKFILRLRLIIQNVILMLLFFIILFFLSDHYNGKQDHARIKTTNECT